MVGSKEPLLDWTDSKETALRFGQIQRVQLGQTHRGQLGQIQKGHKYRNTIGTNTENNNANLNRDNDRGGIAEPACL